MSVVLSLKMKKYALVLALRMLLTMLLAAAAGMLAISGYYWLAAVVCFLMVWSFTDVLRRAMRNIKDMKRLVNAIRFAELNLSFRPSIKKGLPEELAETLDDSLAQFRRRLMQAEANQLFYDTLLQRIDSGIVVSNVEGNIEWINKTAVEMFGKPQPRRLSDLKNVSTELPEMLYQLVPREIKLLTIHRRSKGLIDFVKNYRQLTRIPEPVPAPIPAKEMFANKS